MFPRTLLILAVTLLVISLTGCGGGSAPASTAAAPSLEPVLAEGLAAYEQAVAEDARPGGVVMSDQVRIDGTDAAMRIASDQPGATYPSKHAPDGDWTARELLEWVAANGRPQAARAAQEALGSLP